MAIYPRPAKYEYINMQPPWQHLQVYYSSAAIRYVSKPLLSQPTPTSSLKGWSKLAGMGPNGSPGYLCSASLNGVFTKAVSQHFANSEGQQFNARNLRSYANNLAIARLATQVKGSSADFGVNLAEGRQAVSMIVQRAMTLRNSYLALRKGRFRDFLNQLNVKPLPKHRRWRRSSNASSVWLEYHFGWSPLIQDIYKGVDVLQSSNPGSRSLKASGSATAVYSSNVYLETGPKNASCKTTVKLGVDVTVTNPNLYLANRLGLVNPVSVAWELVPFSFLVDWFLPVGNFLNAHSDFLGVSMRNSYTTTFSNVSGSFVANRNYQDGKFAVYTACHSIFFERSLGLPSPVLLPAQIKGISVTRAATAISLLIQVFKPGS